MSVRPDAVIIGGGPAGSVAALLLARAGWSVALFEKKRFPRRKVCGEYVSATSLPLLDDLGVGEEFRSLAGPKVRQVGLFAGSKLIRATLPRPGDESWGQALDRGRLDGLLLAAASRAGVEVFQPAHVVSLGRIGDCYQVGAESARIGRQSNFRLRW